MLAVITNIEVKPVEGGGGGGGGHLQLQQNQLARLMIAFVTLSMDR
jgi:hypothetical protein